MSPLSSIPCHHVRISHCCHLLTRSVTEVPAGTGLCCLLLGESLTDLYIHMEMLLFWGGGGGGGGGMQGFQAK